jgi:patatin-related protein
VTGPVPSQTPPAEGTTAAEPSSTALLPPVPANRRLTQETGDGAHPRPVTLATQEIRFALAFTGGVSLAIWMGGVAREIDLLVQASGLRRAPGDERTVDPTTPDTLPGRRLYRRLLDLLDVQVTVDVLAGTSAGGINAALLGLVNAQRLDLGPLRDIWLSAGSLKQLMRDPREESPSSLLKGDGQLLSALRDGIVALTKNHDGAMNPRRKSPRPTDVFITTTYLSPETSRYSDDYGTHITDTNHHGLLHFDESALCCPDVAQRIALAARSSASFPAAFEPSFIPCGTTDASPDHPDMETFSNATRSHWAADGGLLANRPLAPLLQSVFDRSTDRQVRRALLYVVPSTSTQSDGAPDSISSPFSLAGGLLRDLNAILNQSIAADLAAIKEHNDRTRAIGDIRLRLAGLGARLATAQDKRLVDQTAWDNYRARQGAWIVNPLVSEVMRQLDLLPGLPPAWRTDMGSGRYDQVREDLLAEVTKAWPSDPHADPAATAVALGRPALDAAKATVLCLLRLGSQLATDVEDRNALARLGTRVHAAVGTPDRSGVRTLIRNQLQSAKDGLSLATVMTNLAKAYSEGQGDPKSLRQAWTQLGEVMRSAISTLAKLADDELKTAPTGPMPPSATGRRSRAEERVAAAQELDTYLRYLPKATDDPVPGLLNLHVAARSMLPVLTEVEQRVELIQVSADTRTLVDNEKRSSAGAKLTGMQFHHFGAFYKGAWRANDWMWGRLDGCGWLVHILLEPHRILHIMEGEAVPSGQRARAFVTCLEQTLETPPPGTVWAELAYLDDDAKAVPTSLPGLSLWAAGVLQRHIADEELRCVATQIRSGDGASTGPEDAWLAAFDQAVVATRSGDTSSDAHPIAELLESCPIADQSLLGERGNPLFLTTVSRAIAVLTAMATAMKQPPASVRPLFTSARTLTRTTATVVERLQGRRRRLVTAGIGALVFGVVLMRNSSLLWGVSGLGLVAVGACLIALGTAVAWIPKIKVLAAMVLALAVALLAATPWLSWLDTRVFPWLTKTAIPWVQNHDWSWPVLLLLVLLPPITTMVALFRQVFHRDKGARQSQSGH